MRTRVLVVDDDHATLELMRSVLEENGYACLTASNGNDALALVRTTPDILVAISDIDMPGLDGISLLQRIRELPTEAPRLIFLTAHPSMDYAIAALRLGAIDFLTKPVRPLSLLTAMREAVTRAQRERVVSSLPGQAAALARHAEMLAATLKGWAHSQPRACDDHPAADEQRLRSTPRNPVGAHASDLALLGLEHIHRLRRDFPLLRDFDDVAWDVLRELLFAERNSRRLSVSALSMSVERVSSTTALRRIQELVKAGHILRCSDPMDARRDFVTLAPEIRVPFEQYLERVAEELATVTAASRPRQ